MKRALYWLVFCIEVPDQRAEFAADEGLGITAIIVMIGLWVLVGARLVAVKPMQGWDWAWLAFLVLVWESYTLRIKRLALDQVATPQLSKQRQWLRALAAGLWFAGISGPLVHALTQDWHATQIIVTTMTVLTILDAIPTEKNS